MQPQICLVPRLSGIGGMVSFQSKFIQGLSSRGISITYDLRDTNYESILVIGGTRHLGSLWRAKRSGRRIVQRLDGMNWIHRVLNTGFGHWLRAEYGNLILGMIRSQLADRIAYQSRFSRDWWEGVRGPTIQPNAIIHNGVDLSNFVPRTDLLPAGETLRILMVEGSLLGGYEFGLKNAIQMSDTIARDLYTQGKVELWIVGKVASSTKEHWEGWLSEQGQKNSLKIKWIGTVDHRQIAEVYQQAHFLFSADINAACPNSVIESIACGTPVLGYDTGALKEILGDEAGVVVPYGGDHWSIEAPDINVLAEGSVKLINSLDEYKESSRSRAENFFDLEQMVDKYVDLLLG